MQDSTFIGLDVHKATFSVAVAQGRRRGEVRHWGTIPNRPDHLRKLVEKLSAHGSHLHFCYEADPCGYGLRRQLARLGHDCIVVAPSLIPMKAGGRIDGGLGAGCSPRGDARSGSSAGDSCARHRRGSISKASCSATTGLIRVQKAGQMPIDAG